MQQNSRYLVGNKGAPGYTGGHTDVARSQQQQSSFRLWGSTRRYALWLREPDQDHSHCCPGNEPFKNIGKETVPTTVHFWHALQTEQERHQKIDRKENRSNSLR